jgi:hypothetical protein
MPVIIHREDGSTQAIDSDVVGRGGGVAGGGVYHEWDCLPGLLAARNARGANQAALRRQARDLDEGDESEGLRADRDGFRV